MPNTLTTLITWWRGKLIGQDQFGNLYYQDKNQQKLNRRIRRWIIYKNKNDYPNSVPPLYNAWLNHSINEFPTLNSTNSDSNETPTHYTPNASLHNATQQKRHKASGDYHPWKPQNNNSNSTENNQ